MFHCRCLGTAVIASFLRRAQNCLSLSLRFQAEVPDPALRFPFELDPWPWPILMPLWAFWVFCFFQLLHRAQTASFLLLGGSRSVPSTGWRGARRELRTACMQQAPEYCLQRVVMPGTIPKQRWSTTKIMATMTDTTTTTGTTSTTTTTTITTTHRQETRPVGDY